MDNEYTLLGYTLVLVFLVIAGLCGIAWIITTLALTSMDIVWIFTYGCLILGVLLIVVGKRKR